MEAHMKSISTSIAASGLLAALALAQPSGYIVTDLGPVGRAPGQPVFVTNNDLVSGTAVLGDGSSHAVLWYKGFQVDITQPGLGGQNSLAFAVNDIGQAVGARFLRPDAR